MVGYPPMRASAGSVAAAFLLASVLVPTAARPAAAADTVCYGASHSYTGPSNPQINVVSFGLLYDCTVHGWQLTVTTSDSWSAASLAQLTLFFDVDGNPATGCGGFDRSIVGTGQGGLSAQVIVTPSCDPAASQVADTAVLVHPQPNQLVLQFTNNDLSNPSSFNWIGTVRGVADAQALRFPSTGEVSESGFPPVPAGNPCPPSSTSVATTAHPEQSGAAIVALRAVGMSDVRLAIPGVVRFRGPPNTAARALGAAGIDAVVSDDRLVHYADVPNDPLYPAQWNLPAINAPGAWSLTHGSASVVVADLDSGVDATHPDLQGKLLPGFDVTTGRALGPGNSDPTGHGTAVAGVIAAIPNNGQFVAGLGWQTSVLPVKLANPPTVADIVAGLHWATDHGAQIINLSLAGCSDPSEAAAVQYAQQHNVLVTAAVGNEFLTGNPVEFPAGYPGVIGVGATARDGTRARYSELGNDVALVAPGGSADGNTADDLPLLAPGASTVTGAGTSFSAPQVAAAAALALAASPSLVPDDAGALTTATATPLASGSGPGFGHGLLNAAATVAAAMKLRRIAGPDRYDTAAAIADLGWPSKSAVVYVASGRTFADALAAGAAAGVSPGPIVLSDTCALPASTAAELQRLHPTTIYVVGGPLAICDAVVQTIAAITGTAPTRIAGSDRYGTDAALVDTLWRQPTSTAFVTTGANFPDGLTGSARAGKDGAPLLLTDTCNLPATIAAELTRLAPRTVTVIGGTVAVCDAVLHQIANADAGAHVVRIGGPDRVATGVMVASDGWLSSSMVLVASAANFPDALSAGAYAAATHVPLLINDACAADANVAAEAHSLGASTASVIGGPLALCGVSAAAIGAQLTT